MSHKFIPYNPRLVPLARRLRNNSTLAEILLWQKIKHKQLLGYDFHRQKPVGNYIVDFYCPELLLAIEIDGCSHDHKSEYDVRRQRKIDALGIAVVRFSDPEVKKEMDGVLEALEWHIRELEK